MIHAGKHDSRSDLVEFSPGARVYRILRGTPEHPLQSVQATGAALVHTTSGTLWTTFWLKYQRGSNRGGTQHACIPRWWPIALDRPELLQHANSHMHLSNSSKTKDWVCHSLKANTYNMLFDHLVSADTHLLGPNGSLRSVI